MSDGEAGAVGAVEAVGDADADVLPGDSPTAVLPRALTLRDLILFNVVAVLSLRWLATSAANGPSALTLWILAAVFFFLPQGLAVADLASRFPKEGGIYFWTKRAWGDGHGFLCGWCYWINNVLYPANLLMSTAVIATYVVGRGGTALESNWTYVLVATLLMLWTAVVLNVVGMSTGKWLQNIGAVGAYVPGVVLVVLAVWAALSGVPAANSFAVADLVPDLSNLPELNLWASIAFAFAGLELCASMGEETDDASRVLPSSIKAALPLIAFLYVAGTAAVLWLVPAGELNIVSGFLQAIHAGAGDLGVTLVWLAPVAAAMYVIGNLGGVGAWLAGPARVAFVIGLDRYFPPAFGKVHPKWKTPYVAILVQGGLATLFLLLSVLGEGTTVERAYLILLDTMLLIYFIPYIYLFATYVKLVPETTTHSLRRWALGASGLLLTLLAMTMAVIPPPDATAWVFWAKVVGGAGAFVALGGVLYWRAHRSGGSRVRSWWPVGLAAAVLTLLVACGPPEPATDGAPDGARGAGSAGTLENGTRSWNVVREEAWAPMRDGVRLRVTLLSPDGEGPFPCLLFRTPYSRTSYEESSPFPVRAARQGFLVALVDVRGRYGSEGSFHAYRQEPDDGHDTVEWLAAHPRCDGNVGSWGGSYPGYVQWLGLATEPEGYVTAAPDMTPVGPDHFFQVGGAISMGWYDWFMPLILPDLRRRAGDRSGPWTYEEAREEWRAERERWLSHRPLVDVPLLREYAPYYYDWLTHPPSDTAFWDFADVEEELDEVSMPVLMLSGWYDDAYGPEGAARGIRGLQERGATEAARRHSRLIFGPWTHTSLSTLTTSSGELDFGSGAGLDDGGLLLDWFGRWLAGRETGVTDEAPVRYFVMGENRWRGAATWPPPEADSVSFYLASAGRANSARGDGVLSRTPPAEAGGGGLGGTSDRYTFDPADPVRAPEGGRAGAVAQASKEGRSDVLVYTTAPLEEPVTVAGEVTAELHVSTDAPDTDFTFMLADVHPDGTSYNVASAGAGILRMRYRNGMTDPEPVEPGAIYRIRISGLHTAVRFGRGHRIRLHVSSSRYPFYDPNPNTGTPVATEDSLAVARQTVWHDAERPSRLILPVVESRAPAAPTTRNEGGGG